MIIMEIDSSMASYFDLHHPAPIIAHTFEWYDQWNLVSCSGSLQRLAPSMMHTFRMKRETKDEVWLKMGAAVYSEIMILMGLKYAGNGSVGMGEVANLEVE